MVEFTFYLLSDDNNEILIKKKIKAISEERAREKFFKNLNIWTTYPVSTKEK